jgi:hypothetical protein
MAVSTTQSIWRSGGGDQTRTSYCGSGLMAAQFYISGADAAGTAVSVSSSNSSDVILPAGAIIVEIQAVCAATGGTTPTFDMGFTLYGTSTATNTGLILPLLLQLASWLLTKLLLLLAQTWAPQCLQATW